MSVVYEPRNFIHDGSYPPMDDHHDGTSDVDRFTDPTDAVVTDLGPVATYNGPTTPFVTDEPPRLDLAATAVSIAGKEESPGATMNPMRGGMKGVLKPEREATRNAEGKYICIYPSCGEEIRVFTRRCEWNKHMDKHDRPYKCTTLGCEKLAGFTYSGGLLRHEREVHGKHGGPKNSLNCPHAHCKRFNGKGFSRIENLNEHLRRVHTNQAAGVAMANTEMDTDDGASQGSGNKRKRSIAEDDALREEVKRLRTENAELRRQVENQNHQTTTFMQQINQLNQQLVTQAQTAESML